MLSNWTIECLHASFKYMSHLVANFCVEVSTRLSVKFRHLKHLIRQKVIVAEVVEHLLIQSNAMHHQVLEKSFFEVNLGAVLDQLGPGRHQGQTSLEANPKTKAQDTSFLLVI